MPNFCKNIIVIYSWAEGNKPEQILDYIKSDKKDFDFNKIIQYPIKYQQLDDARNAIDAEISAAVKNGEFTELLERSIYEKHGMKPGQKDGYNSGGYKWCVDNWGTKWNAIDTEVELDDYGAIKVTFDTAWNPPTPIVCKLAKLFPEWNINFEYYERGVGFCGSMYFEKGEIVESIESKYYGSMGG